MSVLCSCTAFTPRLDLPDRSLPLEWSARYAALTDWQRYSLSARVSVTRGDERVTARLSWRQRDGRSELALSSPLGIGGMDLVVDNTLEQSLSEALGVDVPVKSLKYWLLGVPDPMLPIETLVFGDTVAEGIPNQDGAVLPSLITQAGWQIELRRYMPVPRTRLVLPSRIDLRRDGFEVRVVVDAWGGEI